MKKKILALIIIAIIAVISLSGCTFVKLNTDRQSRTVLRTITKGDISMDITYMELTDYTYNLLFGSYYYYYYISQGTATMEDVVNLAINWKTQSKALTISAMQYLDDIAGRNNSKIDAEKEYQALTDIYGTYFLNKQVMSKLTIAEYYDAISSVNATIEDLYNGYLEENADEARANEIRNTNLQDVKKLTIIEGVKDEYYVGENAPEAKNIKLRIEYTNGETKDIYITEDMIASEFSSSEAGSFEYSVKLDVEVKSDDQYVSETMTATKAYEVVEAPKTKASSVTAEEDEGYLDIIRYMTKAQIEQWALTPEAKDYEYEVPTIIDVQKNYDTAKDASSKKAWQKTIEYLNNANRTVDYYYESAFETAILEAYQAEIYNLVEKTYRVDGNLSGEFNQIFNTEVADKIKELGNIDKEAFDKLSETEKKRTFITAIEDVLDALYYVPTNLEQGKGYVYVSHMLLQFNEDKYPFIINTEPSEAAIADYINSTTVDQLNPRFEVAFVCEGWEYNAAGEYVHNDEKCSDIHKKAGETCKSIAYIAKDVKATTVLGNLADALAGKTGTEAVTIFNEYVEQYGMDSGILAKTNGYLITPDVDDMSWVDGFESLGIVLAASANYKEAGTYKPDATVAIPAMESLYGIDNVAATQLYNDYMQDVFTYTNPQSGNTLYYCVGKTLSSSSGTISGYAGIHVMMVTFCPFSEAFGSTGTWEGDNVINLEGETLDKAVADNILSTKQSSKYSTDTAWVSDYTTDEDGGYGLTLGEKYEGYTIEDNSKLNDYIDELIAAYTG